MMTSRYSNLTRVGAALFGAAFAGYYFVTCGGEDHDLTGGGGGSEWAVTARPALSAEMERASQLGDALPYETIPEFPGSPRPRIRSAGDRAAWQAYRSARTMAAGRDESAQAVAESSLDAALGESGRAGAWRRVAAAADGHVAVDATSGHLFMGFQAFGDDARLALPDEAPLKALASAPVWDAVQAAIGFKEGAEWRPAADARGTQPPLVRTILLDALRNGIMIDGVHAIVRLVAIRGDEWHVASIQVLGWDALDAAFAPLPADHQKRLAEPAPAACTGLQRRDAGEARVVGPLWYCAEGRCQVLVRRRATVPEGVAFCDADPVTGTPRREWVAETQYQSTTYEAMLFRPFYLTRQPTKLRRMELVEATGGVCNNTLSWGFTSDTGTRVELNPFMCPIPDAVTASTSLADYEPKNANFAYCAPVIELTDCTKTGVPPDGDALISFPPKQKNQAVNGVLRWTAADLADPASSPTNIKSQNATLHQQLVRFQRFMSDAGQIAQCRDGLPDNKGNLSELSVAYRVNPNMQDASGRQGGCAIEIHTMTDVLGGRSADTTAHEYIHILRSRSRGAGTGASAGEGAAGGARDSLSPNEECYVRAGLTVPICDVVPGLPPDWCGFWESGGRIHWHERTGHGWPYASGAVADYPESKDPFAYWGSVPGPRNARYGGPDAGGLFVPRLDAPDTTAVGPTFQFAVTLAGMSWRTSQAAFVRAMHTNTGIRRTEELRCNSSRYLSGFAVRDTRGYFKANNTNNDANCACYRASNPCGCTTIPQHVSERQDVTAALALAGHPWLAAEVDAAFNELSDENDGGNLQNRITDDVTNMWFSGPLLAPPTVQHTAGTPQCVVNAPPRRTTHTGAGRELSLYARSTYPASNLENDCDNFAVYPGAGETWSFGAYYVDSALDVYLELSDGNRNLLASATSCAEGGTMPNDACILNYTFGSTGRALHYVRVCGVGGTTGRYALKYTQVGDDHADGAADATPLHQSSTTATRGVIEADADVDWFRVFVPNRTQSVFPNGDFVTRACREGTAVVNVQVYRAQLSSGGAWIAGSQQGTTLSVGTSGDCAVHTISAATVQEGWYLVRVSKATTGGVIGAYRLSVGNNPTSAVTGSMSGRCGINRIKLMPWADRVFDSGLAEADRGYLYRGGGYLNTAQGTTPPYEAGDFYELDFTDDTMRGRYVTVDVLGLNETPSDTQFLDPLVELLPTGQQKQGGTIVSGIPDYYIDAGGITPCGSTNKYVPIAVDDNGGVEACDTSSVYCFGASNCKPDRAAHLGFRINRPGVYLLRVAPAAGSPLNRPYRITVDVKANRSTIRDTLPPEFN